MWRRKHEGCWRRPQEHAYAQREANPRHATPIQTVSRRRPAAADLPDTAIVVVTGTDPDGDAIARPANWDAANGPPPSIFMAAEPRGQPALAPGERVLARLTPRGPGRYEGRTIRRLTDAPGRVLGVYRARPHHPDRSPRQGGMGGAARRGRRRRGQARSCSPNRCPTTASA